MPPPVIPSILHPYIQECISHPSKTLITSVLDAPANWLVLRFIAASLHGTNHDENRYINTNTLSEYEKPAEPQSAVIFISFHRPPSLWIELGKKIGVDFASKRLIYIDGLASGLQGGGTGGSIGIGTNSTDNKLNSIKLRSLALQDVKDSIAIAKKNLASSSSLSSSTTSNPTSSITRKSVIIIDGIDFLLAAAGDDVATQQQQENQSNLQQITQFITGLQDEFSNVVLSVSADSPLIHDGDGGGNTTQLEVGHGMFVRLLAYQCRRVLQTRSLETGRARDVDGVVRVSKGGGLGYADEGEGGGLVDGEWLYQVKGDGSVRVWSRGE